MDGDYTVYEYYTVLILPIDPGVKCLAFEALVAFVVTLAVLFAVVRRSKDWPEAIPLHIGLILLSAWFITHWIDEVVNFKKPDVTPYFIIYSMLTHIARICSDVFIIMGLWQVYHRTLFLRLPKHISLLGTLFSSVLWVLAGVHILLFITTTATMLANVNEDEVNLIARARSAFEVTYMVVQFCAMIPLSSLACMKATDGRVVRDYDNEIEHIAQAAVALLLRSFCEVIIVGQLDRGHADIFNTQRARDVMYGLCSTYMVWAFTFAVPEKGVEDPLVAKDQSAVQEIKRLIEARIAEATNGERNTAPTMSSILDGIEATLKARNIPEDAQQEHLMKLDEIARLRKTYGNWEPVHRGGSNTAGRNDVRELIERNDQLVVENQQTKLSWLMNQVKNWLWPGREPKQ